MERSEPTLVPEWLKSSGSLTGGISTPQSDDQTSSKLARNKLFVNVNGHDSGRSSSSGRTAYSHWSFGSNGSRASYGDFGRNQRDRDWEKDAHDSRGKEKSIFGDRRNRDLSDSSKNTLPSKFEMDVLRRSQSMVSGKHGDTWQKKVVTDMSNSSGNNNNILLNKDSSIGSGNKTHFERDFPSLGVEEISFAPEVGRVASPGLNSPIHSLPFSTSVTLGGEKWTSALAEVPVSVGSNGTGLSVQQASPSPTATLGTSISLKLAEAVAHGPNHPQSTLQLTFGTQRLEELAIKQSRQLIPVTPSVSKNLISISDKQKIKVAPQQYSIAPSLPVSNSPRGGPAKGDVSKVSNVGKLHVLKPGRERNSVTPVVKENVSPTCGVRAPSSTVSATSSVRSPPNNPIFHITERKPVLPVLEKLPTSQARSRKDFFNLVRKKSMANSSKPNSSLVLDTGTEVSHSSDKLAETEVVTAPNTPQASDTPSKVSHEDDDSCGCPTYKSEEKKDRSSDTIILEEKETAFLRSLGWEENSDEGGLTEEEISAFYKDVTKYINSKPSPKLSPVQPKFLSPFDSQVGRIVGISSGLSSSNVKLES